MGGFSPLIDCFCRRIFLTGRKFDPCLRDGGYPYPGQAVWQHFGPKFREPSGNPNINTLSEAELAPGDHACNLLCYGNVAAKISGLGRDLDRMQDAVDAYNAAIESLSERDRVAFATAHLHKAVAMSTIAERTDNIIVLEKALAACRVAAERYDPKCETFGYITAQSRLGAIHYRWL